MTVRWLGSRRAVFALLACGLWQGETVYAQERQQHVAVGDRAAENDARTARRLFERPVTLTIDRMPLPQAIDAVCANAGVVVSYRAEVVEAEHKIVTLRATRTALGDVFNQLFVGTMLVPVPVTESKVAIVRGAHEVMQGIIAGTVTNATTRLPLARVTITIDNATKGVFTSDDGSFRIAGVTPGSHRITARILGHVKQVKTVMVSDGETATVDFALESRTAALDQVIVTGTVVATALKEVPNAMTVITAKQIEERGITRIEQLFRGDVPGVFAQSQSSRAGLDEVVMYSRGTTALAPGDATYLGTNPIKTYVDGVELSNPKYLSQIDPASIERIEILTGPQASTIYGSNAVNGVMQIFTKRGSSAKPQMTLNLLSGWVQNDFSHARTPQHDYSGQLTGVEGRISYSAGGSWVYVGPWTPARQTSRTSAFGGARLSFSTPAGPVTADVSSRWGNTINLVRGQFDQSVNDAGYWMTSSSRVGPETNKLAGQTFGVTLGYTPTSWWSHQFVLGRDVSNTVTNRTAPSFAAIDDTLLNTWQTDLTKRSLQYVTTLRAPFSRLANATVTLGADAWQTFTTTIVSWSPVLTGGLSSPFVSRQPLRNTGAFLQSQIGIADHLFLTYGLRAEWNPAYGDEALPNYAPRYGVAYTIDIGSVTAKLRGAYGRATRPPALDQKFARPLLPWESDLKRVYGNFDVRLANPDLGPEHQQGTEGGLELYFGNHASLVVTRYNQTVDALIVDVPGVDSTKSLLPNPKVFRNLTCPEAIQRHYNFCSSQDPDGYAYFRQTQNMNASGIRNQGWELQGNIVMGPLTTRGMYSWTKSRSMGITAKYAGTYAPALRDNPQYRPGATLSFIPEHTWALGVTYARAQTAVALNINGVGSFRTGDDELYIQHIESSIRLDADLWNTARRSDNFQGFFYSSYNKGYVLGDLTASHRITPHIETVLEVQNLSNRYQHDNDARQATIGRQTRLGFRIRS